jgi:hypothetical protein
MHVHGVREHTGEVFDGWNKERDGERTDDKVRTRHPLEMQASRIARIGDGMSFEEIGRARKWSLRQRMARENSS